VLYPRPCRQGQALGQVMPILVAEVNSQVGDAVVAVTEVVDDHALARFDVGDLHGPDQADHHGLMQDPVVLEVGA
jgi:hypothetical protein